MLVEFGQTEKQKEKKIWSGPKLGFPSTFRNHTYKNNAKTRNDFIQFLIFPQRSCRERNQANVVKQTKNKTKSLSVCLKMSTSARIRLLDSYVPQWNRGCKKTKKPKKKTQKKAYYIQSCIQMPVVKVSLMLLHCSQKGIFKCDFLHIFLSGGS